MQVSGVRVDHSSVIRWTNQLTRIAITSNGLPAKWGWVMVCTSRDEVVQPANSASARVPETARVSVCTSFTP